MIEPLRHDVNTDCDDGYKHHRIETRFIMQGDNILCCPACGNSNVHLASVSVLQGHETTVSTADRTTIQPSDRHRYKRGSAVLIRYQCEAGCSILEALEFHKGITTRTLYARDTDPFETSLELWRN